MLVFTVDVSYEYVLSQEREDIRCIFCDIVLTVILIKHKTLLHNATD